ncbi:unnamed protein product [Sphagnum troendelagicum]|uniref:indole-3-glycerol-phosphate synthase n=1 Tax=Sphagnum troendelagicum TaxID=128251 RepID=A0ABP0UE35_9BRYO
MVAAATQQPLAWCTSGAFFRTVASSSRRCLPYNKRQQQRLCDAASSSSRPDTLDMRRRCCCRIVCEAEGEEGKTQGESRLGSMIRNKQRILESKLRSMPAGELEAKLSATRAVSPPNNLLDTIAQQVLQGRTAIIVEAARLSPAESPESLAQRCANYVTWGASAVSICTDEEKSPNGVADLTAVCTAVNVPVLRKDWILHPLQIAETCAAGASAITAVYSVLSKGTPAILNFAISLGLDAIVEVVNMKELQEVAPLGLPIYGFNLSVGLALSLPGIRQDISKSLIGEIPFGASSVVGIYSIEEARAMKAAGADAVYIKHEVLQGQQATEKEPKLFLENLQVAMSGDD